MTQNNQYVESYHQVRWQQNREGEAGGRQALSNDDRVMKQDIGEDLLIKLFILA